MKGASGLLGPVTAKVCALATALQNTRFVRGAGPNLQQNQAPRHHTPDMPGGEVSKDTVSARSAAAYKLLIHLNRVQFENHGPTRLGPENVSATSCP